ncbi:MAG: TonB-dependent receptor [Thermoanaerobaculia bacterium]
MIRPVLCFSAAAILLTVTLSASESKTKAPTGAPPPPVAGKVHQTIVVTASAIPEELSSTPASATVITKKEIEARESRDVADLLREVPGLQLSRAGAAGKATSLFTRGANSNQTLVLWNGIELNNPYFAGFDWGRFPVAGIQQVEIVRGPYSALYGSDAAAGVVNILTAPTRSEVSGDFSTGERGLLDGVLQGAWIHGAWSAGATLNRREDDGWERNDDFRQNSSLTSIRWAGSSTEITLRARTTSYELGIPTNLDADGTALIPSPRRRQSGDEVEIALPLRQQVGPLSVDLTLSEGTRRDDFEDPDDPWGFVSSSTRSSSRRARLTARGDSRFGTIVFGGEAERSKVDDVTNFGPNLSGAKLSSRSLFVEDRASRSLGAVQLELSAGARFDSFESFGSELSPRISVAALRGGNKLHASVGEGFRAPSAGELYFPFSGNPDLGAERSRSWEIGYDRDLHSGRLLSATFFHSAYDNLIVFDNLSYRFANIGAATTWGAELGMSGPIAAGFSGGVSYTYLHTREEATDEPLLRRPPHSGSINLGWERGAIEAMAVLIHSGRRDDILPVFPYTRVVNGAYTTLDLDVHYRLGVVTPYVKLENATGERYQEVRGYPSPGRRASLGIRFTLE